MRLVILVLLSSVLAFVATAGGVYKWQDADGRWHYGEAPPEGQAAQSLEIAPPPPSQWAIPETPLEEQAIIDERIPRGDVDAYAYLIRDKGYKCSSVSMAMASRKREREVVMVCNSLLYTYTVTDHGGNWLVIVSD